MLEGFNDFLSKLPTTKLRVVVTLALSVTVIIATIMRNYNPSIEILSFLLVSMGLDITQYAVKRNNLTTLEQNRTLDAIAPEPSAMDRAPEPTARPPVPLTNPSDLG